MGLKDILYDIFAPEAYRVRRFNRMVAERRLFREKSCASGYHQWSRLALGGRKCAWCGRAEVPAAAWDGAGTLLIGEPK